MSSQFITNQQQLLSEVVTDILPYSDKLYFLVGYFYFSGFQEIYNNLHNKHLKILVGLEIEQDIINRVKEVQWISDENLSRSELVNRYNEAFVKIFNETDWFDSTKKQEAFRIFVEKIRNGTLEIRKTTEPNHTKLYLFERKEEFNEKGTYPGTVITGSSNLTASGFKNRYELNVILRDPHHFYEAKDIFDQLWSNAVVIADKEHIQQFEEQVLQKIWFEKLYKPYYLYIRVLHEYFNTGKYQDIRFPSHITNQRFQDLKYQTDAIRQALHIINTHNGVIIADVVGLGKSIIAATVAHNLGLKTIIICPPHLCQQWEDDYKEYFYINGKVFSSGKIDEALKYYHKTNNGKQHLIIIDEAHKYRNESRLDYLMLHQLCQGNKVILLTATPYNNRPQDIFTLIKLFQIPSKSTLTTVNNLSIEFESLISQYKKIEKNKKQNKLDTEEANAKINQIAEKIRNIIAPLIIRRSRIDLLEIDEYREDLKQQGIQFPEVADPILLEYKLGSQEKLYKRTLEQLASENVRGSYKAVRYKPITYIKDIKKYKQTFEKEFGQFELFKEAQINIARFMRLLLVRRFESSIFAFKTTLEYIINSTKNIIKWYETRQTVPIFKKGYLPDIEDFLDTTDDGNIIIDKEFDILIEKLQEKGLFEIPITDIKEDFKNDLEEDLSILEDIYQQWFKAGLPHDPKLDSFVHLLKTMINTEPQRKIIVFSEFSDTVNYLYNNLKNTFKVFKYTSSDASLKNREIIRLNFDAKVEPEIQKNDYDILITTDAISEGYNLHRAGTIFNYDIPYNPTRVIQRVGRINRINKKVFDRLYIYNYFPTETGERETRTREISTLKIAMIQALLGEDTKVLTSDEQLKTFFKKQYEQEFKKLDQRSWETPYLNFYKNIPYNDLQIALSIPPRTKIARSIKHDKKGVLVFGKKGNNCVFRFAESAIYDYNLSPQEALKLFEAAPPEQPQPVSNTFDDLYQTACNNLFKSLLITSKDELKNNVCNKLKFIIQNKHSKHIDYLNDLLTAVQLELLPKPYLKEINKIETPKIDTLIDLIPIAYLRTLIKTYHQIDYLKETLIVAEEFN